MRQLSLFDAPVAPEERQDVLGPDSEALLQGFAAVREREGASGRTVLRECSQLRVVARASRRPGTPASVAGLCADLPAVARALREPPTPISRATGRARLVAVQRFIRIIGPSFGRVPAADLATLDGLLPARASAGWHEAGTLVAGQPGRRRPRGPALDAVDLHRIVEAAGAGKPSGRAVRDRALVALQCFSGMRVEEALALRWEDVNIDLAGAGRFRLTAAVQRGDRTLRLLLPGPAAEALEVLRDVVEQSSGRPSGLVFRAGTRWERPLSYRGARKVLVAACQRAALPPVDSAELRAGCAHWLRSEGLSEHEVAGVLGLARVRSVDRLLTRHAALDAQRRVREHQGG